MFVLDDSDNSADRKLILHCSIEAIVAKWLKEHIHLLAIASVNFGDDVSFSFHCHLPCCHYLHCLFLDQTQAQIRVIETFSFIRLVPFI
jgi:hypothetical protein